MSSAPTATQLVTAATLVAASLGIGYAIGVNSRPSAKVPAAAPGKSTEVANEPVVKPLTASDNVEEDDGDYETESEGEDVADGDLSAVKAGFLEPCKMVLVVRTDLKMTSGKIAAQCGHATLACYKSLLKTNPALLKHWEATGQAKVALKADSEDELLELEAIAKSLNLCARSILDAGRTQIAAGSRTVLGIGPAPVELINRVTGKLRLL